MFFKDIVGQDHTIRQLLADVRANRISHARLFLGAEGSGHLPLALALSTYLHCRNRGEQDACGKCPSCLKMKKLEHPDLHFFFPVATNQEHKKDPVSRLFYPNWRTLILSKPYFSYSEWIQALGIENKQAIINADDCNEIIRLLGLKSYESPYKIVVMYMVEKLYHAAAPKLLKILEEPPDNTLFLMISENKELVLNTILSRAQILKISKPADSAVAAFLTDRYAISGEHATRMAGLAAGNICDAIKMAERNDPLDDHFEEFRSWMRLCFKKDVHNILNWIESVSKNGREKNKSFLAYGLRIFRLCLAKNYHANELLNVQGEEKVFIEGFAPFLGQENTVHVIELFNQAIYHVERNANPRILLADLSFQLAKNLKPF